MSSVQEINPPAPIIECISTKSSLISLFNSKENLFEKTTAENNENKPIYKNNKLGVKGISQTLEGKFRAKIYKEKKEINCGTFATIEEAIQSQKQKI